MVSVGKLSKYTYRYDVLTSVAAIHNLLPSRFVLLAVPGPSTIPAILCHAYKQTFNSEIYIGVKSDTIFTNDNSSRSHLKPSLGSHASLGIAAAAASASACLTLAHAVIIGKVQWYYNISCMLD